MEESVLVWLSRNLPEVRATYAGKWIAVVDNQVVLASPSLEELLPQIRDLQVVFITQVEDGPTVWNTAYNSVYEKGGAP